MAWAEAWASLAGAASCAQRSSLGGSGPGRKGGGAAEAQPRGVDRQGIGAVEAALDDLAPNRHPRSWES